MDQNSEHALITVFNFVRVKNVSSMINAILVYQTQIVDGAKRMRMI